MGCTYNELLNCIKDNLTTQQIKKKLNISDKELLNSIKNLKKNDYLITKNAYYNGTVDYTLGLPITNYLNGYPLYTLYSEDEIRLMIISDIHMFNKKESINALYTLYNYCIDNNIHVIVNCGDMLDALFCNKTKIEDQGSEFIKRYPYDNSIINLALMGNHEVLYSKKSGIDFNKLLEDNRLDFKTLGYKNASILIKDDCINLHHNIDNCNSSINPSGSRLSFNGHSHIHRVNDKIINVPTLSYVKVDNLKNFSCFPMALDVTLTFDDNRCINECVIDQIAVTDNPFILSESIIKCKSNPAYKDMNFELDSYSRVRSK